MKIQCDVCEKAIATLICCADEAALCAKCDIEVHAANKLASKHQRLHLEYVSTKSPPCDICQEKTAFIFCVEDRALFCRDCDVTIHLPNSLTGKHQRFLAAGIRVALGSTSSKDNAMSTQQPVVPPNHAAQKVPSKVPTYQASSYNNTNQSSWDVEDLLQFSDFESSDKKEQLGFGELEWFRDIGLFNEDVPQEALVPSSVPQFPPSPITTTAPFRAAKSNLSNKRTRIELPVEDDEYWTVPDLG